MNTLFGIPTATPPLPTPYPTIGTTQVITPGNAGRITLLRDRSGHPGGVTDLAFSPDGKTLAVAARDGVVRLWGVSDGTLEHSLIMTITDRDDFLHTSAVAYSPDGRTLASVGRQNSSHLWDPATGANLGPIVGADNVLYDVAFSPDGKSVATGGASNDIWITDVSSGRNIRTLNGSSSVWGVAFSPDGKMLAAALFATSRQVRLWRLTDGQASPPLVGHTDYPRTVAFSPDGKTLASGSDDRTVRLWRVADGTLLDTLQAGEAVFGVAFSPDGQSIAAGGNIWRVSDGSLVARFPAEWTYGVAFSPDGRLLATGSGYGTVSLWGVP